MASHGWQHSLQLWLWLQGGSVLLGHPVWLGVLKFVLISSCKMVLKTLEAFFGGKFHGDPMAKGYYYKFKRTVWFSSFLMNFSLLCIFLLYWIGYSMQCHPLFFVLVLIFVLLLSTFLYKMWLQRKLKYWTFLADSDTLLLVLGIILSAGEQSLVMVRPIHVEKRWRSE